MVASTRITIEEFLARSDIDERRLELVDGEVCEKMAPRWAHSALAAHICAMLIPFGFPGAEPRAIIPRSADRDASSPLPDAAFYLHNRPADNDWMRRPPDIAIEILSFEQSRQELRAKVDLCREWGVPSVWMVDPERRSIDIYERGERHTVSGDQLITTTVIPQLAVTVVALFARIEEAPSG
jgi:Uma2 family endonuclease